MMVEQEQEDQRVSAPSLLLGMVIRRRCVIQAETTHQPQ